jgi:hypothetical protein
MKIGGDVKFVFIAHNISTGWKDTTIPIVQEGKWGQSRSGYYGGENAS